MSTLQASLTEALANSYPSQWCQAFFILASALILAVQTIPPSAKRILLDYGPRTQGGSGSGSSSGSGTPSNGFFGGLLVRVLGVLGQTPHGWFNHFYVLSVAGTVFWAAQYLNGGGVLQAMAARQEERAPAAANGMSLEQVVLAWGCMGLQGFKRLYECAFILKASSQSKMLSIHWLLGLAYYTAMGISVWVEGSHSIMHPPEHLDLTTLLIPQRMLGFGIFIFGWWQQHVCHKYLASLKKYTLPDQGLFQNIVCAHYFCECLIYLGLATLAAPAGQWRNRTLWCGLLFVAINLGSTANGTKKWYVEKFGADKVSGKWRMIPYIF